MSKNITNNQRPTLNVIDSVSSVPFAVKGSSSDGSVNVNITSGAVTISGVATASNQTGGSQKTQIVDGSGNVIGATSNALDVNIKSGAASGTQYAEASTTSPGTGNLSLGRYKATPPSLTDGQMNALQLDSAGSLKVTGSLSVGGTTDNSAFTANTSTGTPSMGFYHSTIDTVTDGRAATVAITSKRAMMVNLQTSTGAETGIAALPLQVSLANTGANATKLLVTPDSVALPANQSVNVSQINGVTPLMGNGITGTGSLRVTIASDNTAFAVNSTLSAETTKVIGTVNIAASQTIAVTNTGTFAVQATLGAETTKVIGTVRNADGAGNLLTTNSTTYTAKFAQDGNLLGTLGTAFSTAGKVDVKGADGDVFVRQTTAANLNATVVGTGTFATQNTPVAPPSVFNGLTNVTTAGSRVVLAASQAVQSVTIKAKQTNTGIIYVGNSTVAAANGFQLYAGEAISMDVANLNTVNLDSSVNGEGVTYIAVG